MAGQVQAVVASDGRVVCESCAVADSFAARLRGLIGRSQLRRGEGLLLSPSASIHTFFMRFPIDVVFLDRTLRVVGVSPNVRPWKLAACKGTRRVLELSAGESDERAIRVGDQLTLVETSSGRG
jgi:uncharacterized membrane protein (UPF0127 family)